VLLTTAAAAGGCSVLGKACLEITPLVIGGRKEEVSNILSRETQGRQNNGKDKSEGAVDRRGGLQCIGGGIGGDVVESYLSRPDMSGLLSS
jgi:hypothetical protein